METVKLAFEKQFTIYKERTEAEKKELLENATNEFWKQFEE